MRRVGKYCARITFPFDALQPLGSHPISDPLWSIENSQVVHYGCDSRRHEKMIEVSKFDYVLQRIRVCWHDDGGYNCGRCDKFLHFRLALTMQGLRVESCDPLVNYSELVGAHVNNEGEYTEWNDNLILAQKVGHKKAQKALQKLLNTYKTKKAIKLLDDSLLGGRLFNFKRWVLS